MATYGVYGGQYGASAPAKPKATDVFSQAAPASAQGVAQNAQPSVSSPAAGAAPANPFGPVAPAANPGSFESLLNNAGPARQQNVQAAQQTVSQQLMPSPAPSRESATARTAFIKAQAEAGRQNSEASSLSGRLLTGQAPGDVANFNRESLGQRADLENKLAINDSSRADAQRQQGVSNLLAMEGLASGERVADKNITSQEKLGFADLSVRERTLAQAGEQFDKELDFKKYATERGYTDAEAQRAWQGLQNDKQITSQEKLGFADLSVKEKQLAQDGAQFTKEMDFKKYATDRGFTDAEAARAWEGIQNDKKIASTEKVAFAGLAQEDRALAQQGSQFDKKIDFDTWAKGQDMGNADRDRIWQSIENEKGRVFTSAESALDRTLNSSQFAETIGLSKQQFSEQIRQFDSKQDFDKWATKAGLDAQAAELVWKSNEADVSRKWETGERLSTQDHQVNLSRLTDELDQGRMQLQQTLNLDTLEKQAQIDAIAAQQANSYQTFRDTRAMSHDQAMEQMKAGLTSQLEQAGYDHQTALQAAEIQARAFEGERNREMATLEAQAELAYKYNALATEAGLTREQITARKEESVAQISLGLQELGLNTQKFEAELKSQDFQDRAGMLSTMMELGGDNPDVADRAASGYLALLKEKGMITEEQYAAGLAGIGKKAPAAPTGTGTSTTSSAVKAAMDASGVSAASGVVASAASSVGSKVAGAANTVVSGTKKILGKLTPW